MVNDIYTGDIHSGIDFALDEFLSIFSDMTLTGLNVQRPPLKI